MISFTLLARPLAESYLFASLAQLFPSRALLCTALIFLLPVLARAQTGTALVQHAPSVNGAIQGSVQQMAGESVTLNGGVNITGDLLVPGTPSVQLNGTPTYGGTLQGSGSTSPANYTITLNTGASLSHVIRRTNPTTLPTVSTVPTPTGTTSVTVSTSGQAIAWSGLKNLTLNSNVGVVTVPAGTYGNFIADSGSGFKLGVVGATQASVYNIQNFTLNGSSSLQVLGPVVINLANGFSANSTVGAASNPAWLTLNIKAGGFTLNSGCNLYGYLLAPSGTVIINSGTQLVGGVICSYLTVNGNGLLKLQQAQSPNQSPVVSLTAPANNSTYTAPASFTLSATASDPDGAVTKVEFFKGTTKLGEDTTAPYSLVLTGVTAGPYSYFARATDNSVMTTDSSAIAVTVNSPNQPPTVSLTAPADGVTFTAPATITLKAAAADTDGTIGRVDFYQGSIMIGQDTSTPYQVSTSTLSAGVYVFSAKSYDNAGAFTISGTVTVTVVNPNLPPTVMITAPADGTNYDDPASFTVTATAADPDGTVYKVGLYRSGVLTGEDLTAPFSFAVSALPIGTYDYIVRATDNLGFSTDSAPVRITVAHINDAPTATVQSQTTPEETPLTITLAGTDPDGDPLTYDTTNQPVNGTLTPTASPSVFTYTPNLNFNGTDSFTFKVNDTALDSAPATVSLTVTPVNDAPISYPASVTLNENTVTAFVFAATDVDSSSLTFSITTGPSHGTYTGTLPNVTYTPNANYSGPDSLMFRAFDGQAYSVPAAVNLTVVHINQAPSVILTAPASNAVFGAPSSVTLAATASDTDGTVTMVEFFNGAAKLGESAAAPYQYNWTNVASGTYTLTAKATDNLNAIAVSSSATITVNAPPVANAQSVMTDEDTPLVITLVGSDPEGSPLTYSIVGQPAHGSLAPTASPTIYHYTPEANATQSDSFTFKVNDGTFDSAPAAVAIAVAPVNDAPVADPKVWSTLEDTPLRLALSGRDVEGATLTYSIVQAPMLGTLEPIAPDGTVVFHPAVNSNEPVSFTYVAGDGALSSAPATVSITITPVNDGPVADPAQITVMNGIPAPITLTGSDLETPASALIFHLVTLPAHGACAGTLPNLTYNAEAGYVGTDSIRFTVDDGINVSAPATVTINIIPKNNLAPVANAGPDQIIYAKSFSGSVGLGRLVIASDEWYLSDYAFDHAPTTGNFARNLVGFLANGRPGRFLARGASGYRGFGQAQFLNVVNNQGYSMVFDAATPPTLAYLRNFDAVFVDPLYGFDPIALTQYVREGGSVYMSMGSGGSGAVAEATITNPFLRPFGLQAAAIWNSIAGIFPVAPDSPLSAGVTGLYFDNGASLSILPPADPSRFVIQEGGSYGMVGFDGFPQATTTLNGTVVDDELPLPVHLTNTWTLVSGQADGVRVLNPGSLNTELILRQEGDYLFKLHAADGALAGEDTVLIRVLRNNPPLVSAGPDRGIQRTDQTITLVGTASDDGRPAATPLSVHWSVKNAPVNGAVNFGTTNALTTTASFNQPGLYVLELRGDDSLEAASDYVEVRVGLSAPAPVPSGLLAWWPGNGTTEDVASGIFGSPLDLSYTLGLVGDAFNMAASGLMVVAARAGTDVAAQPNGFTIEFWTNPGGTSSDVGERRLMAWTEGTSEKLRIVRYNHVSDSVRLVVDSSHSFNLSGSEIGAWAHIAITYDKTTNQLTGYVDGVLVKSMTATGYIFETGGDLSVGGNPAKPTNLWFNGQLDEVAFYNRPLGSGEIARIYDAGKIGKGSLAMNQAPLVNAGSDISVVGTNGLVTLHGIVSDDGLPIEAGLSTTWQQVSGPVKADIGNAVQLVTTVGFTTPGIYNFQLSADDGLARRNDTVEVRVGASTAAPAPSGLLAWWPGNGTTEDVVSGIFGAPRDLGYAPGMIGDAFNMAASGLMVVPARAGTDVAAQPAGFTIEFWMNAGGDPWDNQERRLLAWTEGTSEKLHISRYNYFGWVRVSDGAGHQFDITGTTTGVWAHVVISCDRPSNRLCGYVNGVMKMNVDATPYLLATGGDFAVGGSPSKSQNQWYSGQLDEVSFYNRPLTTGEIAGLYAAVPHGKAPYVRNTPPSITADPFGSPIVAGAAATLTAVALDDGLPNPPSALTYQWSKISGPGTVTFTAPALLNTSATFGRAGSYVLQVRVSDSELADTDTVVAEVLPAAPIAAIASPTDASSFYVGQPVQVRIAAADGDGTVALVEYFDGVAKIGERISPDSGGGSVFTLTFGFIAGTHSLSVRATDDTGLSVISAPVAINIIQAIPTISLTSPADGSGAEVHEPITLQATAAIAYGTIAQVEFFDGATKLGETAVPSAPNTYTLAFASGLASGSHVLTARTIAADGGVATSLPVNFIVTRQQSPIVSISSPVNGAKLVVAVPVAIKALASDRDSTITRVEFFDGAVKLGERIAPDVIGGSVFTFNQTAGFTAGTHVLTVKVISADDGSATSAPASITVLASLPPPPELKLISPAAGTEITSPTNLVGTAAGLYLKSYSVQVRYRTPAHNAPWKTVATGTTSVTDGVLGQLDPTLLRNGLCEIRLTATDQLERTFYEPAPYHWVSIIGGMKIGAKISTNVDLTLPAPGLPLRVVRHYDSTDPRIGDFGVGTSMANQSYSIQLSNTTQRPEGDPGLDAPLGAHWFAYTVSSTGLFSVPLYVVDPAPPFDATGVPPEPRVVTITLPDNTLLRFSPRLTPNKLIGEITFGQIVFDPLPGTVGKLEPLDESTLQVEDQVASSAFDGYMDLLDYDDGAPLDPGAYRLTALDGTQYIISTTKGVLKVTDRNGNSTTYSPNRIAHSNGTYLDIVRDTSGRIIAVKDPAGETVDYVYDSSGRLLTVTDREGRVTTYGYLEGTSLVTSIKEPAAILPEYDAFDAVGRFTSRIGGALANGGTVTEHDLVNKVEKFTDTLSRITKVEYDEFGNVVKHTNALNFSTTYAFNDSRFRDKATLVTDAENHSTFYHYNAQGLVDTVTDANNHTTGYTYNANGQLLTETDALNHAVIQTYDTKGNLLTRTDREGNITAFTHDSAGNVLTERSPLGNETRFTYNSLGLPLSESEHASDGTLGRSRTYTYDTNGNLSSETSYHTDAQGEDVPVTTLYEYNLNGQLTKTTYPDATFATKVYNVRGLLSSEQDRSGAIVTYTYDAAGRLTRTTFPDQSYEEKTYDAVGRVVAERNALGQTTTNTYDNADRLLSVAFPGIGAQDRTYDKVGRMLTESDEGGRVATTAYDPVGNITKVTYPDETSTDLSYDAVDNLKTASARVFFEPDVSGGGFGYTPIPAGTDLSAPGAFAALSKPAPAKDSDSRYLSQLGLPSGLHATPASYTPRKSGHKASRFTTKHLTAQAAPPPVTPTLRNYVYTYDANGRVKKITNPDASFSSIEYDAVGRPTSTTNEEGITWTYAYDVSSNNPAYRTGVFGPGSAATRYSETYYYDKHGNMSGMIDALGNITEHHYNEKNQLTDSKYSNATGAISSTEVYSDFDLEGRPGRIKDREGFESTMVDTRTGRTKAGTRTTTRVVGTDSYVTVETYDAAGNLVKVVDPRGAITEHTYDYFNRRTQTTLPDARKIKTFYGAGNRVDKIQEISSNGTDIRTTEHEYDANNHLLKTTRPDGSIINYDYFADGRLHLISQPYFAGDPVRLTEITYDDVNRVTRIADPLGRPALRTHDRLGRLTEEKDTALTSIVHTYDELNRLTSITVTGQPLAVTNEVVTATSQMTYDLMGNLLTQTEAFDTPDARTTSYSYEIIAEGTGQDAKQRTLVTATYADGSTMKSVQDNRGLVTSVTDRRGHTMTTTYDALGRPTLVSAPLGQTLAYTYPNFGETQVATDALSRVTSRTFDTSQRVLEEKLPGTFGSRTYSYDNFGQLRTAKNTRGVQYTTVMEYDPMGRPNKITRPDNGEITTTYTAFGEPYRIRDARGVVTRHDYNSLGLLAAKTVANGDPKARTTSYGYDTANRINQIVTPNFQTIDIIKDALGRVRSRTTLLDAAPVNEKYVESLDYYRTGELKKHTDVRGDTAYSYDFVGRPKTVTNPLNKTTTTGYDSEGNLVTLTDANNHTTSYTYDELDRLKVTTLPTNATETNDYDAYHLKKTTLAPTTGGGSPIVTDFGYDDLDHATTITRRNSPLADSAVSRKYDGEGNLIEEIDPDGRKTSYHYDLVGLVDLITYHDGATEAFTYDDQGNRRTIVRAPDAYNLTYTYTPFGEVETAANAFGTVAYTYDGAGNRLTVKDPLNHTSISEYDVGNRLRKVTLPGNRVTNYDYELAANRVTITDPAGRPHIKEFDALGRLKRSLAPLYGFLSPLATHHSDPSGSVVNIAGQSFAASQLTYDPTGNLAQITDANNHITRFSYDAGNRLTHTYLPQNPATANEVNTYDFADRRTARADADGAATTYAYDCLSRLTNVSPPAIRTGSSVSYSYQPSGLRQTMTDSLGTTNYTYNDRGLLRTEQTPYAGTLTYTHDTLGRLTNLRSNNVGGVNTAYVYDAAARLTHVADVLRSETTQYEYFNDDQLKKVTQPNGTVTTQTYDLTTGLPDTTITAKGSTALFTQQYSYTPTDQVATLTTNIAGSLRTAQFTYDDSDRLLREVHTGAVAAGQIDYTLDPAGNRTARSSTIAGIGSQSFVYDANNAFASLFTYDTRGNPTAGPLFPGSFSDSYDFLDHQDVRTGQVEYLYDGDGRRVGQRSFDAASGRWTTQTRLISLLNPTGYDQDVEEFTDGVLTSSYTLGRSRLAGQRYVDEATTAHGLTIALGSDGKVYTWGNGQTSPTQVSGLTNIISVGAGASHYLALGADGKVYSWGLNNSLGQLGRSGSVGTPTAIPGLDNIAAISTQLDHTLALKSDGTLYAWGDNSSGQLGDGTTTNQTTPVQVMTGTIAIAAGQVHSYALTLGGQAYSWGDNAYGQLGRSGAAPTLTPTAIAGLTDVAELAAGAFHTLALKNDGMLVTWGDNSFGQLGDPIVVLQRSTPAPLVSLSGLTAIAAGSRHSLALRSDGTLLAWGDNHSGQLGTSYPTNLSSPTAVSVLSNIAHLGAGARSSYATTASGATYVMGANRNGQLGTGNTDPSTGPVLLPPATNPAFTAIFSGGETGSTRTAQAVGPRDQFFAPDIHGHTHLLTDITGTPANTYTYDAFGDILEARNASGESLPTAHYPLLATLNPYLYRGERLEADTGRYHLRARDYDASLGRLATLDTIIGDPAEPMSLNRYGYAEANPIGNADPSGHFSISVWSLLGQMDEINRQWDEIKSVGYHEEFDPNQALANYTSALAGGPTTNLVITKKERSIWVNPSRGGGMIGSLIGESGQGYNEKKGMNEGFATGSDVFFHTNAAPRHRLSMIERTVEQASASAYNLRNTFNTGLPAISLDSKAWTTRWPAYLYHDALLQAQLRGQMIDGPVEARFTLSLHRKLYSRARTPLTAVAMKSLCAAQGGGLLDWQSPAREGAPAAFLQSVQSTGFERSSEIEAMLQLTAYQTRLFTGGVGAFANALHPVLAIPNAAGGLYRGYENSVDRVTAINSAYGDVGAFELGSRTLGAAAGEIFGANNLVEGTYGFDVQGREILGAERAQRLAFGFVGIGSTGFGMAGKTLRCAPAIENTATAVRAGSRVLGVAGDLAQDIGAFGRGYSRNFNRTNAGIVNSGVNPTPLFRGIGGGINELAATHQARALAAAKSRLTNLQTKFEELAEEHLLPKYRAIDPGLEGGYTGSFKTGTVGNRSKSTFGQPINLSEFDIDYWIKSDVLFEKYGENLQANVQFRKLLSGTPGFEGLKPNKKGFSILFKPSTE